MSNNDNNNIKVESYPKIWALGHRNVQDILQKEVTLEEKYDGSQFIFGRTLDGHLVLNSKGAVIDYDAPQKLFEPAVNYVKGMEECLPSGVIFYSETLSAPRHNTLKYNSVPKNHIALFGVWDVNKNKHLPWEGYSEWADFLGIGVVPLLARGEFTSQQVMEAMDRESYLGGPKMEGVVAKLYEGYECHGKLYPVKAAKYVSEEFKEKHKSNPEFKPGKNKMHELFEQFNTEARFQKAVQHLRDRGELEEDPRDIGSLMKELNQDLEEEWKEEIKEELWKIQKKDLLRTANKGLPEWYKQKLAQGEIT